MSMLCTRKRTYIAASELDEAHQPHFLRNLFFHACNFFSNEFQRDPLTKIGLRGQKTLQKNVDKKFRFLSWRGGVKKFRRIFGLGSKKSMFFFSRSINHLGRSKRVLGALKCQKTAYGGVKCQNSSKNRVWVQKKVNF